MRYTKLLIISICIVLMTSANLIAQELDPAYHNNEEIFDELTFYSEEYPDWIVLDSIGHSAEYGLPIWMVKISDNPDRNEPEAAILLVGQVHAEEVVGVEIILEIMKQLLDNNEENDFRQRLEGLELYLIPTANPEGLEIVHSGVDVTFRKNCRDNIGDGELRIQDGTGWDTSGVDINRNFGLHWDRGDTLFRPEENYIYNTYRGAAPFSEPESQALRDLALQHPFLYSIVYHGSRSGNSAELLIAPWFWRENNIIKRPPDASAINALGESLAELMPKQNNPDEHYRSVQSMQRKGQLQDWFYVETGTIQYMAEVGAEIQPDEEGMRQVVADNLAAVWYMMDLALGIEGLDGFGTLTFIVEDNETSEPLEATIIVDALEHPVLKPRHTNRINGRFDWLLEADQYDITIKKHGYETQTFEDYEITDGERTVLEVSMESIEPVTVRFRTIDLDSATVASRIMLDDSDGNRVFDMEWNFNGEPSLDLQPMLYDMTITSPGYLPIVCPLEVTEDAELSYTLLITEIEFVEDFNSHGEWQRGGDNEDWGVVTFEGRTALTESVTGDYPTDAEVWLQIYDAASLDNVSGAVLELIHRPYFEPGYDYGTFEFFTDFEDITVVQFSQFPEDWDTLYFNLDDLERGMLQMRFEVISDHAIGEDGWLIDKVTVYKAEYENTVAMHTVMPMEFSMTTYPNPFNSSTKITYSLPVASNATLQIVDIQGRVVETLMSKDLSEGWHNIVWNAENVATGIYFCRLSAGDKSVTTKLILTK
ncbi:MAG: T9SS type A sorting domain-containing protein [Calditrichaeota bacterium]|nr:T9SS type A sorting domain-containing protein [Calditrichota bacterium]